MSESANSHQTRSDSGDTAHPQTTRGVNQLGYRGWSGDRQSGLTRWVVISQVGVRRAWQNLWLKRLLFFAWLPAIWFGVGFFLWEQAALYPDWRQMIAPIMSWRDIPHTPWFDQIRESFRNGNLGDARHTVWAWLLYIFFLYPQGVLMVLVVGLISPPLISQDIRSRAFLLYFSRPLTRTEYIIGKMGGMWVYLSIISLIPAFVLYCMGIMLSPNLSVIAATWDLPLRVLAASIVLMLPTSALALCLSSLSQESRYAGFAWFAIWILGWFTYFAAALAETFNAQQRMAHDGRLVAIQETSWSLVSLYHTQGYVQSWLFGFANFSDVWASALVLSAVTIVSLFVLYRRISAPMQV